MLTVIYHPRKFIFIYLNITIVQKRFLQHYCNFVSNTKMSSFTIEAILGKRQECATIRTTSSGNSDEEKRDGNMGKFLAMNYLTTGTKSLSDHCFLYIHQGLLKKSGSRVERRKTAKTI